MNEYLDEVELAPRSSRVAAAVDVQRLASLGIGALVEYALFRHGDRSDLPPLPEHDAQLGRLHRALSRTTQQASSLSLQPVTFDVVRLPAGDARSTEWEAFCKRAEVSAREAGIDRGVAAGLAGAIKELADNVDRHSQAIESGVAGFAQAGNRFEYVVADSGIGMLASLRECPEFRELRDDVEALPFAIQSGVSRFGRRSGAGYGYRAVFAPLRALSGTIRLRSGAAVLEVSGDALDPDRARCSQRPYLQGVTASGVVFAMKP